MYIPYTRIYSVYLSLIADTCQVIGYWYNIMLDCIHIYMYNIGINILEG